MKVVLINISDIKGGASIVANRLRISLRENFNVQTTYFVADKNLEEKDVLATRAGFGEFFEKAINRILSPLGLQYQFFPFSASFMLRKIKEIKPDVISLHNTHGGYFETRLLIKISKIAPVLWTLHDMWAFTGNAAHTFGNESWKHMDNDQVLTRVHPRIGINTGKFLLRQKARIYRKSNLKLIVPCMWLRDLAIQSPVFKNKEIIQVYNGIDLNVFCPQPKVEMRQKFDIPTDAKVIMFSAGDLVNNMWKGGDHLIQVLKLVNSITPSPLHLIIVGSGELEELVALKNFTLHKTGYLQTERDMARCFSASDLFIYPTKADTLPNVLVEAMGCGTPCVTFDIGGCEEIILNDETGYVVQPFQITEMANLIVNMLFDKEKLEKMSKHARLHAEKNFSIELMTKKYYTLFEQVNHPETK